MSAPDKSFSRRKFLTHFTAAGAGVAAGSVLSQLEVVLPKSAADSAPAAPPAPTPTSPLPGDGYAFTAEAGRPGQLLRWGKVAEAAPASAPSQLGNTHNHDGFPYHVQDTKQWIMVIDLAKCDGCADCTAACKQMHDVPPGQEWIKIYQLKDMKTGEPYWFPRVCMQCDNTPCVKVCPVGATFKREDRLVLIDQERCIGCRFCLAACPYSARYFNWAEPPQTPEQKAQRYDLEMNMPHRKGVAEKCLFCPTLTSEGKLPACVGVCTMDALYFGDQNEGAVTNRSGETISLHEVMAMGAFRHMEELGTEPRVYYLPPRGRKYPAPSAPADS